VKVRKLSALPMRSEVVQRGVAVEGAMVVFEAAFSQRRNREMGGGGVRQHHVDGAWPATAREQRAQSGVGQRNRGACVYGGKQRRGEMPTGGAPTTVTGGDGFIWFGFRI
jgi:hypothetical protein